jgi:cytochrome b subunit of formate dehydrogenase
MTTISRILEKISSRFLIARWVPHELSTESKANRVDICQEMLEVLEKLSPQQKNYVTTGNECWIYFDNYHRGQ